MMAKPGLLVFDGDETVRGQMRWAFCRDYEIIEAGTRAEALMAAGSGDVSVGIIGMGLPPSPFEPGEGMGAMQEILSANPLFKAVVVTGLDERENAFRALDLGAFDYLTKPVSIDEVRLTVKRAYHTHRRQSERLDAPSGAGWPPDMLGVSIPMQEVFNTIRKLAEVNIPALVRGGPGAGKETAARAIHRLGARHPMPFVAVDCALAPERVIETEALGFEGAGPGPQRKCRVEQADGGTIYLKEVGAMGLKLQGRLLKLLQEHALESRFAGGRVSVDVRVIASTVRDLRAMVRSGEFREDLFHRLGVIPLDLPPLRERSEDIHLLSLFFLKKYAREFNRPANGFSREALEAMESHAWRGNIKELENRTRRAVLFSDGSELSSADMGIFTAARGPVTANPMGLAEAREAFKRRMIQDALSRNRGSVGRAASDLGISRQYLSKLMVKYNMKPV